MRGLPGLTALNVSLSIRDTTGLKSTFTHFIVVEIKGVGDKT